MSIDIKNYVQMLSWYCIGLALYILIFGNTIMENPPLYVLFHLVIFNLYYFFVYRKLFYGK